MKAENIILPFIATHPGSLIQDEILFRKMSQKELALRIGVQKSFLNELIKGKRAINADIALLLEQIFEISAEYWMNLQSQFELDQARLKQKTKDRLANAASWGSIPVVK
ncbi:MAG: addiction module antidote protein HigA family [Bacteroidota bacterium]|jgi:HTH-type transcriptional regulator/antitoxin HigA